MSASGVSSLNFNSFLKLEYLKSVFILTKQKYLLKEINLAEQQSHEHNKGRGIISNKIRVWSGGSHFPVFRGSGSAVSQELCLLVKDELAGGGSPYAALDVQFGLDF